MGLEFSRTAGAVLDRALCLESNDVRAAINQSCPKWLLD